MGHILPLSERQQRPIRFDFASGYRVLFQLVDEASSLSQQPHGEYLSLVQFLEAENGERLIRLSCYRRPVGGADDSWDYGSQTSFALHMEEWRGLLSEALRKPWFRELVDQALAAAAQTGLD